LLSIQTTEKITLVNMHHFRRSDHVRQSICPSVRLWQSVWDWTDCQNLIKFSIAALYTANRRTSARFVRFEGHTSPKGANEFPLVLSAFLGLFGWNSVGLHETCTSLCLTNCAICANRCSECTQGRKWYFACQSAVCLATFI
jgi:hypothetical protein